MRRNRLNPRSAERLLDGDVPPDDAPPAFVGVARLLQAARVGTGDVEQASAAEAATVAAMAAAVTGRPVPVKTTAGGKNLITRHLSAKVGAAAAAVVLLGGGAAAAATGSLPGPVQNTAAHVLSDIGISVPDDGPSSAPNHNADHGLCNAESHNAGHPNSHATGFPSQSTCSTVTAPGNSSSSDGTKGPSPNADYGLCNAESHNAGHPNSHATVFPPTSTCTTVTAPGHEPGATGDTGAAANGGTDDETTETTTPGGPTDDGNEPSNPDHTVPGGPSGTPAGSVPGATSHARS